MRKLIDYLQAPVSIAPLAFFRIAFGALMFISTIRFAYWGWIDQFYIQPDFHFTFLGFDWVKPFGPSGMYILFGLIALSSLFIMFGFLYRFSSLFFFIAFTYVELLDKTFYLNHYYFVSIISFLIILLPANAYFSVDAWLFPKIRKTHVPRFTIGTIKLQLALVYIFAGIAKINYDWLIEAEPLKIWLPAKSYIPVIGNFLEYEWLAYFFSWFGCIYDLLIPFFLLNKSTRNYAFIAVILFHVLTRILFPIGMFPYIMIVSTLIFFDSSFHQKAIDFLKSLVGKRQLVYQTIYKTGNSVYSKLILGVLVVHFTIQVFLPFRYLLYEGNLFWTEEGYRFSWRVMLMEKAGTCLFYVSDPAFEGEIEINNRKYLTFQQEMMMSTQPDMILQFAHFLRDEYAGKTITIHDKDYKFSAPIVKVISHATLNGSGSRPFINPTVDLAKQEYNLKHRTWVLPLE